MASVGTLKARRERAPDAPEDDPMSEAVTISPILDDWSTRRLLVGWREGQRAAGRELFVRHYEKIYRFFDSKIKRNVQELVEGTFRDCLELASTEVEVRVSIDANRSRIVATSDRRIGCSSTVPGRLS